MTETDSNDREQLFVYGTLMPGGRNYVHIAPHACNPRDGVIDGVLIDRGRSPGLVPGAGIVRGVVLEVSADGLAVADEIEDHRPHDPGSRYVRRRRPVRLAGGGEVLAWCYDFGDPDSIAHRPHCTVGRQNGLDVYAWPYKGGDGGGRC